MKPKALVPGFLLVLLSFLPSWMFPPAAAAPLAPPAYPDSLTYSGWLPFVANSGTPDITPFQCSDVVIRLSPAADDYAPGETVDFSITGVAPADGQASLHWARASANLSDAGSWQALALTWTGERYAAPWVVTGDLPGPPPFDQSGSQEFVASFSLWDPLENRYVCSGNLYPGPAPDHPELAEVYCPNCMKAFSSRQPAAGDVLDLTSFWNAAPGLSVTYRGERLDNPLDDYGTPVSGDSLTRMEYEAPVQLCDWETLPQRFTKNNRWGYWDPAAPDPADRNGSIWTEGNAGLRFFLTGVNTAALDSPAGALAHKVYRLADGDFQLGELGDELERTILHTSFQLENFRYPPYLLAYPAVPLSGFDTFSRIDSIYHYFAVEDPQILCLTKTPTGNHSWHTRSRLLDDPDLAAEFDDLRAYFNDAPHRIAVLTFFEGGDYSLGRPALREDWYLMEGVGLVGVDQAGWDPDDATAAQTYLDAVYLKPGEPAAPAFRMRAERAYLGDPLEIVPVSPATVFPLVVPAGSCYTVAIRSSQHKGLPYDGRLETNAGNAPSLWVGADGQPKWVENGLVTECLPEGFPSGNYQVRLRADVAESPSIVENSLSSPTMPWSVNELWVVVP